MGVKNISSIELGKIIKIQSLNIIDIRPEGEYALGHIPEAKNIALGNLLQFPEQYLNKKQRYYIICDEGKKSIALCFELCKKGFDVVNVLGGIQSYKETLVKS